MTYAGFLATKEVKTHKIGGLTIRTERHISGSYSAIDADSYEPGQPVGWDKTEFGAIADLAEIMRERGYLSDEEESEVSAVEWRNDHARDLRKVL